MPPFFPRLPGDTVCLGNFFFLTAFTTFWSPAISFPFEFMRNCNRNLNCSDGAFSSKLIPWDNVNQCRLWQCSSKPSITVRSLYLNCWGWNRCNPKAETSREILSGPPSPLTLFSQTHIFWPVLLLRFTISKQALTFFLNIQTRNLSVSQTDLSRIDGCPFKKQLTCWNRSCTERNCYPAKAQSYKKKTRQLR